MWWNNDDAFETCTVELSIDALHGFQGFGEAVNP